MKFLVDANLPFKLAINLRNKGYDAIHTDNLPNKERTKDSEILSISQEKNRIVISKDSDFLDSHIIKKLPKKLLLISTGNITNKELLYLIENYFEQIEYYFTQYDLIEINNFGITCHDKL